MVQSPRLNMGSVMTALASSASPESVPGSSKGEPLSGIESIEMVSQQEIEDESRGLQTILKEWNKIPGNFAALELDVANNAKVGDLFRSEAQETVSGMHRTIEQMGDKIQTLASRVGIAGEGFTGSAWDAIQTLQIDSQHMQESLLQLEAGMAASDQQVLEEGIARLQSEQAQHQATFRNFITQYRANVHYTREKFQELAQADHRGFSGSAMEGVLPHGLEQVKARLDALEHHSETHLNDEHLEKRLKSLESKAGGVSYQLNDLRFG